MQSAAMDGGVDGVWASRWMGNQSMAPDEVRDSLPDMTACSLLVDRSRGSTESTMR